MTDVSKIMFDERFALCESSVVQISQKMPPTMNGHVNKGGWDDFCSKIDKDLKRLTSVRAMVTRILLVYLILMVAYYVCVEHYGLIDDYRPTTLIIEIFASLGILFAIVFLYVTWARCSTMSNLKRHCTHMMEQVCPQLELKCNLPFFQFTGGIAKGWYILVISHRDVVETA